MAAFPTVILGFIAGLWLAPFLENYLVSVFLLLLLVPFVILLVSFSWNYLPVFIKNKVPEGYVPLILIPFIILTAFIYSIIVYFNLRFRNAHN